MSEENVLDVKERLARIEVLLTGIDEKIKLKQETTDEKIKVANHRIQDLEDTNKWLSRTSIGALITGFVGLLFAISKYFK